MDTRAQLIILLNQKVLTSGRRTTALFVRDLMNEVFDSVPNILDDKDSVNGYLGIDSNGRVNVTRIKVATPINNYLRDDGTWQPIIAGNMDEKTIDITGLTDINLTGETANIINLISSNVTEQIDTITGYTGPGRLYLRPSITLNLTVNDASVNAGNIHLYTTALTAFGTKRGYLKVETRNSEFYQNEFIDQYV